MLRKCFVLLLLLILVGCNVSPTQTAALSTPLPPAPKPTNTIQLQTVTPRPSATNSLSLTAMAVPTITSTPAPTLTANERQALVRKLLLDNGGCELPCWWGITPGTTTLQTAKDLLTSQGIKWFRDNELHFDPPLSERSVGYRVDLYFVQRAEYMQSIQVQSEVLGDPQTNHFAEDWRRYSLDQVLTRYGIPTQIWLGIGPVVEQGAKLGYVLTVVSHNFE